MDDEAKKKLDAFWNQKLTVGRGIAALVVFFGVVAIVAMTSDKTPTSESRARAQERAVESRQAEEKKRSEQPGRKRALEAFKQSAPHDALLSGLLTGANLQDANQNVIIVQVSREWVVLAHPDRLALAKRVWGLWAAKKLPNVSHYESSRIAQQTEDGRHVGGSGWARGSSISVDDD